MSSRLSLRPNPFPATIFSSTTHFPFIFLFPKLKSSINLSLFSSSTTTTTTITTHSLPYGPSLLKGIVTTQQQQQQPQDGEQNQTLVFDESQFTRIFYVAALRVPAKDCFALESRLRGHLLNWPRIRNIARVPGDEIDPRVFELVRDQCDEGEEDGEGSGLECEEWNSVLYRDKLAKSFNARGFVKFRNLARISRPKRRRKVKEKRREEEEEDEKFGGKEKGVYMVKVVEEVEGEEKMRRLLGDEFRGGEKWRGSTRLLLLDEKLVDMDVEYYPQAIKVLIPFWLSLNLLTEG